MLVCGEAPDTHTANTTALAEHIFLSEYLIALWVSQLSVSGCSDNISLIGMWGGGRGAPQSAPPTARRYSVPSTLSTAEPVVTLTRALAAP